MPDIKDRPLSTKGGIPQESLIILGRGLGITCNCEPADETQYQLFVIFWWGVLGWRGVGK